MNKFFTLLQNIILKLNSKADLVDGKIPASQLPDDIGSGGGGGLTEVAWEDVKDKPFEDTRIMSHYSYDENPNPVSFDNALMGYSFYKVSDFVLTKDEIFNTKITINGKEIEKYSQSNVLIETDELIVAQVNPPTGWAFCFCNTTGVCNFTFSGYPLSVDIPEVGIYRVSGLGLGMSGIDTIEILVGGELKCIDEKFIPDTVARQNDLDRAISRIDSALISAIGSGVLS